LTRSPTIARVAGRNVRLPMIETRTTPIVPTAIEVNRVIPRVNRPASEIITARPLKKTARPAVLLAISIASGTERPWRRSVRNRVTMKSE
jgi:hypothetical protein